MAVYDKNRGYTLMRWLTDFTTLCHYGSVRKPLGNLPKEGTYIVAPCHQNGLMEPMLVLQLGHRPVVFLCRGDLFANPILRRLFTFLRMLPIFRMRDGMDLLKKDGDTFDQSHQTLLHGMPLCLMAEGRQNDRHQLLPLKKGMFRIATRAQNEMSEPLSIIPVGIDYDHYTRPFSNVVMQVGEPIAVQPFMAEVAENEPVAFNQMRDRLREALVPLMHHIESQEHYEEFYLLSVLLTPVTIGLRSNAVARFKARQRISAALDALEANTSPTLDEAIDLASRCHTFYSHNHIAPLVPKDTLRWIGGTLLWGGVAAVIACCPLARHIALDVLLAFPLLVLPTHLLASKLFEDTQFHSSANYVIRFVLGILYTVIAAIVVGICHGILPALALVAAAIALAWCQRWIIGSVRNTLEQWHLHLVLLCHGKTYRQLQSRLKTLAVTLGLKA